MGLDIGFTVEHYPEREGFDVERLTEASASRIDTYLEYMRQAFPVGVSASAFKKQHRFQDSEGFWVFYIEYSFHARIHSYGAELRDEANQTVNDVYLGIAKFIIDTFPPFEGKIIMTRNWSD